MADNCGSVVEFAAQTGRLDFVSLILASIGIILVFGGLFSFVNFRSLAKKQAVEVATKVAEDVATKVAEVVAAKFAEEKATKVAEEEAERAVNEYLQKELPELVNQYMEFTVMEPFSNDDADEIASAQDKQTDD